MARRPRRLARPKPTVRDLDRVLVVCEGEKTEPRYLLALKERYRINTLSVEGIGGDPFALIGRAIELSRREKRHGERYEAVWCVFDYDDHAHFDEVSRTAKSEGFNLARSWPCFEYWLLLHFEYSRKPYTRLPARSPCAACIKDLRAHLPMYEKADEDVFAMTHSRLPDALDNAERAQADARATGEQNPSTEVHKLVKNLTDMSRQLPSG